LDNVSNKHDLPLSRHLRSTGHHHSFDKLNVTIIDHNPKWDDKSNVSNSTVKNIFENGMIPKLIQKTGPPQCGIYTLGKLSTLYVLIRLENCTVTILVRHFIQSDIDIVPRWDETFVIQQSVYFFITFFCVLGVVLHCVNIFFATSLSVSLHNLLDFYNLFCLYCIVMSRRSITH
jgi:hypothetical protein